MDWIYENSTFYLKRKYEKYIQLKTHLYSIDNRPERKCSINGCNKKHQHNNYCWYHNYHLNGGKEKRHERWINERA